MENILIKSCNGAVVEPSEKFQRMYADDLNFSNLKVQLLMLPNLLHTANEHCHLGIKKIMSISTICEVFNASSHGKIMLNEVHRMLRIYLTVPMTTATAERTLSTLRRLKNCLRTTMTQKRVNHVVLLHTHKSCTDNLDLVAVAQEFSSANNHWRAIFGNFSGHTSS